MATLKERLVRGLERQGWAVDKAARSTKYTVLRHPATPRFMYVGKAGALRCGTSVASSVPVPEKRRNIVLADGDKQDAE